MCVHGQRDVMYHMMVGSWLSEPESVRRTHTREREGGGGERGGGYIGREGGAGVEGGRYREVTAE